MPDRLAVAVAGVAGGGLDRVTHRVAQVQHLAAAAVALVLGHHARASCAAQPDHHVEVHGSPPCAHARPERPAGDQGGLHHLDVARGQLLRRQRVERGRVARAPPTAGGRRPRSSCPRAGPRRSCRRRPSRPAPRASWAPARGASRAGTPRRRSRPGRPPRRRPPPPRGRPRSAPARASPRSTSSARGQRLALARRAPPPARPAPSTGWRRGHVRVGDHEAPPVGGVDEARARSGPRPKKTGYSPDSAARPHHPRAGGRRGAAPAARAGRAADGVARRRQGSRRRPPTRRAARGRPGAARSGPRSRASGRPLPEARRQASSERTSSCTTVWRREGLAHALGERREPPPSATTRSGRAGRAGRSTTSSSRARNAASPSRSKKESIGSPRLRSSSRSESIGSTPISAATVRAAVDLPAPMKPTSTIAPRRGGPGRAPGPRAIRASTRSAPRRPTSAARTSSMWSPPSFSR